MDDKARDLWDSLKTYAGYFALGAIPLGGDVQAGLALIVLAIAGIGVVAMDIPLWLFVAVFVLAVSINAFHRMRMALLEDNKYIRERLEKEVDRATRAEKALMAANAPPVIDLHVDPIHGILYRNEEHTQAHHPFGYLLLFHVRITNRLNTTLSMDLTVDLGPSPLTGTHLIINEAGENDKYQERLGTTYGPVTLGPYATIGPCMKLFQIADHNLIYMGIRPNETAKPIINGSELVLTDQISKLEHRVKISSHDDAGFLTRS